MLRSFLAAASTLKSDGKFAPAAVLLWHLLSAAHSVTAVAAQMSGADPSYLPAASVDRGARLRARTVRTVATDSETLMVFLRPDTSCGGRVPISSPCSRGPSCMD